MMDETKFYEMIQRARNEYVGHSGDPIDVALRRVEQLVTDAGKPLSTHAADVVAEHVTTHKITMIKELRTRTGDGLKECKDAIEDALVTHLEGELYAARRSVTLRNNNDLPPFA